MTRLQNPRTTWRINWPAVVLAAAFVAFAGYQSNAMRHLMQLKPAVVATVDLHRALTQTEERHRADAEVKELVQDLQKQGERHVRKIRELEEEMGLYASGSDKHQQVLEKVSLATLEYQGFSEWARRKVEAENAIRLRQLYRELKSVIAEEAREKGCDVVFVNDALGELRPGDEAEVTMQISMRRMLYANPALDITDAVIARMNAATRARVQR